MCTYMYKHINTCRGGGRHLSLGGPQRLNRTIIIIWQKSNSCREDIKSGEDMAPLPPPSSLTLHTCTCTHACAHTYACTHACTHTRTHTCTYTYTHTHSCIHTLNYIHCIHIVITKIPQ